MSVDPQTTRMSQNPASSDAAKWDMPPAPTIDADYHRMVCGYCRIETDVEVKRYRTASPQHVDLECTCQNCGAKWQAAEDTETHG